MLTVESLAPILVSFVCLFVFQFRRSFKWFWLVWLKTGRWKTLKDTGRVWKRREPGRALREKNHSEIEIFTLLPRDGLTAHLNSSALIRIYIRQYQYKQLNRLVMFSFLYNWIHRWNAATSTGKPETRALLGGFPAPLLIDLIHWIIAVASAAFHLARSGSLLMVISSFI